jgi:hypothetical protein
MKRLLVLVAVFSMTLFGYGKPAQSTNETKLPEAPDGYRWERFAEVQSAFLCPVGWHRFHKAGVSSHTYSLSVESVAEHGSFETGMTLQVIKDLMKKKGIPPSVFAIEMTQLALKKPENARISSEDLSSGPFKAFGVRYRNAPSVAIPIIIHQVAIANDKTDTLFIATFEAPENTWTQAWKLGEVMIKKFLIDDEY